MNSVSAVKTLLTKYYDISPFIRYRLYCSLDTIAISLQSFILNQMIEREEKTDTLFPSDCPRPRKAARQCGGVLFSRVARIQFLPLPCSGVRRHGSM
jgi:hypothetical protein